MILTSMITTMLITMIIPSMIIPYMILTMIITSISMISHERMLIRGELNCLSQRIDTDRRHVPFLQRVELQAFCCLPSRLLAARPHGANSFLRSNPCDDCADRPRADQRDRDRHRPKSFSR